MIALAQRPYQNGKNVQPLTVGDIGAGAVIGVDEFYVAGSHGYYYHVMLGDWRAECRSDSVIRGEWRELLQTQIGDPRLTASLVLVGHRISCCTRRLRA